jgi:hypothetical protein
MLDIERAHSYEICSQERLGPLFEEFRTCNALTTTFFTAVVLSKAACGLLIGVQQVSQLHILETVT